MKIPAQKINDRVCQQSEGPALFSELPQVGRPTASLAKCSDT